MYIAGVLGAMETPVLLYLFGPLHYAVRVLLLVVIPSGEGRSATPCWYVSRRAGQLKNRAVIF